MAKQSAIEQDGVIIEALSNAMFRVELEKDHKDSSPPEPYPRAESLYNAFSFSRKYEP